MNKTNASRCIHGFQITVRYRPSETKFYRTRWNVQDNISEKSVSIDNKTAQLKSFIRYTTVTHDDNLILSLFILLLNTFKIQQDR